MDNTEKAFLGTAVLGGLALAAYLASAKAPGAKPPGACQPPDGVGIYCGSDGKTIYAWNQVNCKYDSMVCTTGKCETQGCVDGVCGKCVSPSPTGAQITSATVQVV